MKSKLILMTLLGLMISGCASQSHIAKAGHANCTVCTCENDLACIDVKVDANTPKLDYNGKTYFFCSEECKSKFARNPSKYLSQ